MRVLKTMNTIGEVKRDSFAPPNIGEGAQLQRRGAKTLEKVNETIFLLIQIISIFE
jgi:hypothetical protein